VRRRKKPPPDEAFLDVPEFGRCGSIVDIFDDVDAFLEIVLWADFRSE
jgi:hypothetical protein